MPVLVSAKNTIYSIDIDVYLNEDGSANITEVWDVDGEDGTEWYKVINNLGNMDISDFRVSMDGTALLYKRWNVDEGLFDKRGYYGINHISNGVELCFGKYDYDRHRFTLSYKLSNFIINTEDSQLIYYNFIDKLSNVDFRNFSVTISSYYEFSNTLDVWGYGYKGYAYVRNGKIYMSNEEDSKMDKKYVVLLTKFPLRTFNTSNSVKGYTNFEKVYKMAKKDSFSYSINFFKIIEFFQITLFIFLCLSLEFFPQIFIVILEALFRTISAGINFRKYGYINNKKIHYKDILMYRDIPCNGNICYAQVLLKLNDCSCYKKGNLIGAIILSWARSNKIVFKNEESGIFNRNTSVIDLTLNPSFDNIYEEQLFKMLYEASRDGYLKTREFEKWCRKNYEIILDLIEEFEIVMLNNLKADFKVYHRINDECKQSEVMNDVLYNDSVKLLGLKKYLKNFSNMHEKEAMDVKLWDEYLIFACLFGMTKKVSKQLNYLYHEVIQQMGNSEFNYDTIRYIDRISTRSVRISNLYKNISYSNSRNITGGYSSGGGGFSSGGGGGGSFGGGGGGSR